MMLDLLLRWGHILPAIVMAGGLFFLGCVWLPAVRRRGVDIEVAAADINPGWSRIVAACTLLLLVTGIVNFVRNVQTYSIDSKYHMLLGIKLLLGLALFFLAAILAGKTGLAKTMRQNSGTWLPLAVVLAIALAMMGGLMRQIPRTAKIQLPEISAPEVTLPTSP